MDVLADIRYQDKQALKDTMPVLFLHHFFLNVYLATIVLSVGGKREEKFKGIFIALQ